jgi:hypothetical protein
MIARALLLGTGLLLAGCQSSGKEDVSAALTPKAATATPAPFPVKSKDGTQFGGNRAIPNECLVPAEGKQGGKPLSKAMIEGWPPAFIADVAIMEAALAGVAYPEEVAYIQDCMQAKVEKPQTPGQMTATGQGTSTPPAPMKSAEGLAAEKAG